MASEAEKHDPDGGGGQQGDNIVNEQPIEISSESSNEESDTEPELDTDGDGVGDGDGDGEAETEADVDADVKTDSDSDVSIINSVSDSSDSHDDQKLEDEFNAILSLPSKRYKQYMQLCHTAFKLNVFDKIQIAITEFEQHATIPPHIWLRYLKTLKVVTQTAAERVVFNKKCAVALSSHYDEQLAQFVAKSLEEQPIEAEYTMWAKLLADYGLERVDFVNKLRELLGSVVEQEQIEKIEEAMNEECVTWNSTDDELESIEELIEDFNQKLKSTSKNWSNLQVMFISRAEKLPLENNVKCTLGKLIYERCLAKYPTDSGLWLDYINYMQKSSEEKDNSQVKDGYLKSKPLEIWARAVQVTPSVQLNHKFLQLMELYEYSLEQVDQEINRHFERIERYMELYVELKLDYLAYRVRHIDVDDEEQVNDIRAAFRNAWDRLSDLYGDLADTGYEVLQLWAQVEYGKLNSPENGAAIWIEILNYPGTSYKSHLWLAYAQMENDYNDGKKMRSVLRQALMALPADAHQVAELYRRYERCFGSYETIAECQTYCQAYVQESGQPYNQNLATWSQGNRGSQMPARKPFPGNRKPMQGPKKDFQLPKKQLPIAKKEMTKQQSEADEPKGPNFKYSPNLEANKIFIKNLYAQCTKEELTKAFQEFGTIKDVRLVYKLNQRFKGIAYIEYDKPEEAQRAVIRGDGLEIGGQNIVVAISNPPPKPSGSGGGGGGSSTAETSAAASRGEKRRIPTSLIPTKLVMQEVKRRKILELNEDAAASSSKDANGKSNTVETKKNGKEIPPKKDGNETTTDTAPAAAADETPTATATAPKSNDDFRKLFNI